MENKVTALQVEYVTTFWDWKQFEIAVFKNNEVTCFFSKETNMTWCDVVPNKLADDYRRFLKTGKVFNKKYRHKEGKFEWFQDDSIDNVQFKGNMFWYDIVKTARLTNDSLTFKVTQLSDGNRHYEIAGNDFFTLVDDELLEVQDELQDREVVPLMAFASKKGNINGNNN